MVEWREINKDNYNDCLKLAVSDAQKHFVASNAYSLAQAWVFYETAYPLAIYADNMMVGFILYGPESTECGMYMNIDRFMIDQHFQGKGYGKSAFAKLLEVIKHNFEYTEVYLSYKPENRVAEH